MKTSNVGSTVATQASKTLTATQHAERALTFGASTRLDRGGPTVEAFNRLPKPTQAVLEALQKVDNFTKNRVATLGLVRDARTSSSYDLAPSKLAGELQTIEKAAGKKASTLLSEGAKLKGIDADSAAALNRTAQMLRGGVGNDERFASALKLERMKEPERAQGPSVTQQRAAIEEADRGWAPRRPAQAGSGINWNKPANSPTPLFKR